MSVVCHRSDRPLGSLYRLTLLISKGDMFGQGQPVILHLLDLPVMVDKLRGIEMELEDAALPLVRGVVCTGSAEEAFAGVDVALLVGAKPRTKGMERSDLLRENARIFRDQGASLDRVRAL